MSPEDDIKPVQAFFLLDATQSYHKYIGSLSALHERLMKRSEQSPGSQQRIQPRKLILLDSDPIARVKPPGLERCDLGRGLKLVLDSLSNSLGGQAEVFVLLQNLPGGDWGKQINELAKRSGIGVHVFQLAGFKPPLSEEDVSFMKQHGVDVRFPVEQGKLTDYIFQVLKIRISQVDNSPFEPVSYKEQASQPLAESSIDEPRSLQIVLTPQQPKKGIPLQTYSEDHERAPLEAPKVGLQQDVSRVEESKTMSQPADSLTVEDKTELQQVPASQPEEIKVSSRPRAAEAAPLTVDVEPEATQPTESSVDEQPQAAHVEKDKANSKSEIDLAKKPGEAESVAPVAKPEPKQPFDKDGVATIWKNLEPPPDMGDRIPHTDMQRLNAGENWMMVAASRRGKMHAHEGTFREDAFGLGYAEGWNFMVVADGGGSRPLARVGANLAAAEAIDAMCREARNLAKSEVSIENACRYILENGIHRACDALQKEAQRRERKIWDFGTTYLAVAHHSSGHRHILGTLQVGDGLIAAMLTDHSPLILADPDTGEGATETLFITGRPWNEWVSRIKVYGLDLEPIILACMCDGVSEDLKPYKSNLPQFFVGLSKLVQQEAPEQALLESLGYEKRSSFDDRTLALICRRLAGEQAVQTTAEELEMPPIIHSSPEPEGEAEKADAQESLPAL